MAEIYRERTGFFAVDIAPIPVGPMGMATGMIPDSAIWAQYYDPARPAWTARLRNDNKTMDRGFPTYFRPRQGQENSLFRVS